MLSSAGPPVRCLPQRSEGEGRGHTGCSARVATVSVEGRAAGWGEGEIVWLEGRQGRCDPFTTRVCVAEAMGKLGCTAEAAGRRRGY